MVLQRVRIPVIDRIFCRKRKHIWEGIVILCVGRLGQVPEEYHTFVWILRQAKEGFIFMPPLLSFFQKAKSRLFGCIQHKINHAVADAFLDQRADFFGCELEDGARSGDPVDDDVVVDPGLAQNDDV